MLPNSQSLMGGNGSVSTADIFTNSVSPPSIFSNGVISRLRTSLLLTVVTLSRVVAGLSWQTNGNSAGVSKVAWVRTAKSPVRDVRDHSCVVDSWVAQRAVSRSSSVASDAALPQDSMTAPIQALETLRARSRPGRGYRWPPTECRRVWRRRRRRRRRRRVAWRRRTRAQAGRRV